MKWPALVAIIALGSCSGQPVQPPANPPAGRYQLISAMVDYSDAGGSRTERSVFRIDTATGQVSYFVNSYSTNLGLIQYMDEIKEFREWLEFARAAGIVK